MHKIQFSIEINAPREKVWNTLWDEDSFRDWTSVFSDGSEGSHIKSDWKEGSRFEFFESDTGSYGFIGRLVPNEFISFRHQGEIYDGEEHPFDDRDRLEQYILTEEDGITTLVLEQHIPSEFKELFEEATPKAFRRIKELAEKTETG